jgi:hypothetical protein
MSRVLVVGVPRSGTTWVATLLGSTKGSAYLEEPDNHLMHPFAFRAKHRLPGRFYTALEPDQRADEYETLWRAAFRSSVSARTRAPGPRPVRRALSNVVWRRVSHKDVQRGFREPNGLAMRLRAAAALAVPETAAPGSRNLVVKSVYAPLSVEWIAARFPVRVVIVVRDLLNVLSSWVELQWVGTPGDDMLDGLDPVLQQQLAGVHGIPVPEQDASPLVRGTWLLGMLDRTLREAARRHPDWILVRHEELCDDPGLRFRTLSHALGLEWTTDGDRTMAGLNLPGRGIERARVASELPEIWRSRLAPAQIAEIASLAERFHEAH